MLHQVVARALSPLKFDRHGIPLRELIAVHRRFRPVGCLPGNLGDGFLLATNPVFRNIRSEFRRRRFSFTTANVANYFAFPLMALDEVIEARRIPYHRNYPWLETLEGSAPATFTLTELKKSELKFNYLFHESAHCIAHDLLFGRRPVRLVPKTADTLLKVFLGEAFANMVEALSSAFVEGEIGSYLLDANCHFRANQRESRVLVRAVEEWGAETAARLLLGAFLYSNYLYESLGAGEHARIGEFAGVPAAKAGPLIRIGLQLNEEFREVTTPLHLVKCGFSPDVSFLLRGDPLKRLLSRRDIRQAAERLCAIAAAGIAAPR